MQLCAVGRGELLIMQPQYKMSKLAGCVKVNWKLHYKTRYRNRQLVNCCRAEQGGFSDGRRLACSVSLVISCSVGHFEAYDVILDGVWTFQIFTLYLYRLCSSNPQIHFVVTF